MIKNNYTLGDWGYFKLLQLVAEGLDFQGINYALVGGGAVQARVIEAFNKYEKITAPNVPELLLRKTKDFDITTHSTEGELVLFLNLLQLENEPLSIRPKQPRRVNIFYSGRNFAPVSVVLNYQIGPQDFSGLGEQFYNECLNTAEDLYLRYNNEEVRVRVATPECIIASKLTRSSPKDIVDISGLLRVLARYESRSAKPFNYELVKQYLKEAGKEHCFQNLDEIMTEVLKE
ncbi:MAG: hypothetical protein Q8R47_00395 [Nanoarchaeota archaeon]|nr:hypothetical protein [Nanoarchaeota archaeon]